MIFRLVCAFALFTSFIGAAYATPALERIIGKQHYAFEYRNDTLYAKNDAGKIFVGKKEEEQGNFSIWTVESDFSFRVAYNRKTNRIIDPLPDEEPGHISFLSSEDPAYALLDSGTSGGVRSLSLYNEEGQRLLSAEWWDGRSVHASFKERFLRETG